MVADAMHKMNNNNICLIPNVKIDICKNTSFLIALFAMIEIKKVSEDDKTKLIIAIINASEKNILNTSLLLEPIARNIPISSFL